MAAWLGKVFVAVEEERKKAEVAAEVGGPTFYSTKIKIGKAGVINVISGSLFVSRYDFGPAATAITPPFDAVYATFKAPSESNPNGVGIVMHTVDKSALKAYVDRVGENYGQTEGAKEALCGAIVRRNEERTEKYHARYPGMVVSVADPAERVFWYDDHTLANIAGSVGTTHSLFRALEQ